MADASIGRVPANDLDAEASVISVLLAKPKALNEVIAILQPDDFYNPANGAIYETICDLTREGQPVDPVQVASRLQERGKLLRVGGAAYIASIVDEAPTVYHVEAYAKTVARKAARRRIVAEARVIIAEGTGDDLNEDEWIANIDSRLSAAARSSELRSLETLGDVLKRGFGDLYAQYENPAVAHSGARFGIRGLDEHFGFLRPGGVTIIGGYPGDGKSALGLQAAIATAKQRDHDVNPCASVVFSVEMPSADLGLRSLFQQARVDSSKARPHRLRHIQQNEWGNLVDAVSKLGHLPVWFDDSEATHPDKIRATIRRTKAKAEKCGSQLRLAVVDYLQLVSAGNRVRRRNANREEEVSAVAWALKSIAKGEGIHIIALAQLNSDANKRPQNDRRPTKDDIRESKAIGQHCDNMVLIYNPEARQRARQKSHDAPRNEGEPCELIVDKFRGGRTGTVDAMFWPHLTMFGDVS